MFQDVVMCRNYVLSKTSNTVQMCGFRDLQLPHVEGGKERHDEGRHERRHELHDAQPEADAADAREDDRSEDAVQARRRGQHDGYDETDERRGGPDGSHDEADASGARKSQDGE